MKFHELAAIAAREAYDENFSSRRGIYEVTKTGEDGHVYVIYDNNPFAKYPMGRDLIYDEFRSKMTEHNIRELATASWPVGGESDGYTIAIVIATELSQEEVTQIIQPLVKKHMRLMSI